MHRRNDILNEKQVLASFISRLPGAIIICEADGTILLHNSQSENYLQTEGQKSQDSIPMTGRPIAFYIDKNLIEHALDDITGQLTLQSANPVSSFILPKNNRILQTQVVPVLSRAGLFSGFVVILEDITRQNRAETRVESLLKTLSQNARSPIAGVRAAIEAMRRFPGMDETRQQQFKDIIYNESIVLSDMLSSVSDEYQSLVHDGKSLKTINAEMLLQTVARRSRERLGIALNIKSDARSKDIKIKADPYLMINVLLFLLHRLKTETGLTEFDASLNIQSFIILMDICWTGAPISPALVRQWKYLDIGTQSTALNMTLKEALNRHQSAIGTCSKNEAGQEQTGIRFFIPEETSRESESFEPVSALPETRIQIRDMDLFDHSSQTLELDNRLLTELSYTSLIREINQAGQVEEIIGKHSQLPRIIHSMLTSGTKIRTVTWLITAFSDAILNRLMTFAIEALGPPPVPFAFVTLGSEGRKEQTLKTDQDNAIIFKDPADGKSLETLQSYFLELGEKVCTWLNQADFDFCQGGIMAKNPKWCQPLSVWKHYFSSWTLATSPIDLLHTSIFFDFRFAYGDKELTDALANHLIKSLSNWTGFFRNMTENAVACKPPIGFFGNFLVNSKEPHKNCLNIKLANIPIVDFARIYSLKHGIRETSTQERLYQLYVKRVLSREGYNELDQAYSFMMQLRFMVQVQAVVGMNLKPDNFINPKTLSSIEKKMLKEVLKKIKSFQEKLSFDFMGGPDQQMS